MGGKNPLDLLGEIGKLGVKVAAAGGLTKETAAEAAAAGADIVIVGASIIKSADAEKAAREIRTAIDAPGL